jgi:hypothetical protein
VSAISGVRLMPGATFGSCLQATRQLLANELTAAGELALSDRLDRKKLDFSLGSIPEIDRYLSVLHENEQEISGMPLLFTIWAVALYVGEVIRREVPEKKYEWVTISENSMPAGCTTAIQAGIGTTCALRATNGDMSMPSLVVLRIILRGSKARSVDSYIRGTVGLLR